MGTPERLLKPAIRGGVLLDQPVSTLFVVLPSDLDSWDDNDPSIHHFRIYFLCND